MSTIWGVLPFVLVAAYLALCIYIGIDMSRRVRAAGSMGSWRSLRRSSE
jgi:hypothetical protein